MDELRWMDDVIPRPDELLKVGDKLWFKWIGRERMFEIVSVDDDQMKLVHGCHRFVYTLERDFLIHLIEEEKIKKKCGLSFTTNILRWV